MKFRLKIPLQVTLDVTYKTHPALDSAVGLKFALKTTTPQKLVEFSETFFRTIPKMSDEGKLPYRSKV